MYVSDASHTTCMLVMQAIPHVCYASHTTCMFLLVLKVALVHQAH